MNKICIKYGKCSSESKERLDQVRVRWREDSNSKHPLLTLISYADKLELQPLVDQLKANLNNREITFIHNSCRTDLRNASRRIKPTKIREKSISVRSEHSSFDFKRQCFYCERVCIYDEKHPDRNRFEEVRTKGTGVHKTTLELCRSRDDKIAESIYARLVNINDLLAVEARYHVRCTVYLFEFLYFSSGRMIVVLDVFLD